MHRPPDHAATQARFHAALWVPEAPEGFDARRFAVYRNNVQHGLTRALAARFPTVERLLGVESFTAVARVFAATHPPKTPVLLDWGDDFPAFLGGFPPLVKRRWLADVARLEWARGRAYHAADAPVADPAALAVADPGALHLRLAPSVIAFSSPWPAVSLWQQNQPDAKPAPRPVSGPVSGPVSEPVSEPVSVPARAEQALIARTRGFAVIVEPLHPAQFAVLAALLAGQTLAGAAADTDPAPLLAHLLRHGLIAAIGDTP